MCLFDTIIVAFTNSTDVALDCTKCFTGVTDINCICKQQLEAKVGHIFFILPIEKSTFGKHEKSTVLFYFNPSPCAVYT